jgi:[citrate (pro-3S)-lyase] ligase
MSEDALGTDLDAGIDLRFDTVELTVSPEIRVEIARLLHDNGLELDEQIENFVVCREDGRLVGCAGFDRDVIKDVAVAPGLRGTAVSLRLGGEVVKLAAGHGYHDLFLFCRPDNVKRFRGWAFHPLVEMPGVIALMENNPIALPKYLEKLSRGRRPGKTIGGVVLNANPFTLGHRFLVEQAAKDCDWLHVFVVREDASQFSYADRFRLVSAGVADIGNVILHEGSKYIISRATFPGYFLKEKAAIDSSFTGIDLLMFRERIAPALGINRRYVGTEPLDATTNNYNASMKHWLADAPSKAASIETVIIERLTVAGSPVSASKVRALLAEGDLSGIKRLVPPTTFAFLTEQAVPARRRKGDRS